MGYRLNTAMSAMGTTMNRYEGMYFFRSTTELSSILRCVTPHMTATAPMISQITDGLNTR